MNFLKIKSTKKTDIYGYYFFAKNETCLLFCLQNEQLNKIKEEIKFLVYAKIKKTFFVAICNFFIVLAGKA